MRPIKIPALTLAKVRELETELHKEALRGNYKKAKSKLNDLRQILTKYHHTARLMSAYLTVYEAALEAWELTIAEKGFQFVRERVRFGTRLRLEATALLAITRIRLKKLSEAKPLIEEVLRDDLVIKSPVKRHEFRIEIIKRFDQEGAVAALAESQLDSLDVNEVYERVTELLRKGADERDIEIYIGDALPLSVKRYLWEVDRIAKNALPADERMLLPGPDEIMRSREAGAVVFGGIRRKLYMALCDPESEIYKKWLVEGVSALADKNFLTGVLFVALSDFKANLNVVGVGISAMVIKLGLGKFCSMNTPVRLMSLRGQSS